jgi:nucleoside transporter
MAAFMTGAGFWAAEFDGPEANPERAFWPLFALMLGYNICCLASMTLTNVIGFRNLADPRTSFGYVRLVGTLGWIVSGIVLAFAMNPVSAEPLFLGAGASVLLALASRWLPHTPPKGQGRPIAEVVGLPAIQLLRKPIFIAFAIVAFACNALNQFYAVYINPYFDDLAIWKPEAVLTLAQWAEIVCMAISPWLVMRWGLKWVMLLGLCGWTVRNALLYLGDVPSIIAVAVPMHGVGFALFGMLGSIFVDREAPPHLRAGAQALVMLLTNGPALLLGNYAAGQIVQSHQLASVISWPGVWFVSVIGYALATLFFFVFFRETERNKVGNANSPRE